MKKASDYVMEYKSFEDLEVYKAARAYRKKGFPFDYLEDLKKEGYRVNKILNRYIAYLKKRKAEGSD